MAYWDIYKKKGENQSGIVIGLRCPYLEGECKHIQKLRDGRTFCKNFVLHEEIRGKNKQKKHNDEPEKKAA
jgi:hypothetical protein